jgi:transcriptional regulator with XRE-family HTH domain
MKAAPKPSPGLEIRRTFAKNLKRLRENRHISQLDLSSMTGLAHNFINDIENCKKWISTDTLAKFAAALEAQPFQFFLSEFQGEQFEHDPVSLYREDFTDMFQKAAAEWVDAYLPAAGKKR